MTRNKMFDKPWKDVYIAELPDFIIIQKVSQYGPHYIVLQYGPHYIASQYHFFSVHIHIPTYRCPPHKHTYNHKCKLVNSSLYTALSTKVKNISEKLPEIQIQCNFLIPNPWNPLKYLGTQYLDVTLYEKGNIHRHKIQINCR